MILLRTMNSTIVTGNKREPVFRYMNLLVFNGMYLQPITLKPATHNINSGLYIIFFFPQTPDSPMWLLSRGKTDKARKVLMKLRGYVSEEKCATEFQEMVQYVSQSAKSGKYHIVGRSHVDRLYTFTSWQYTIIIVRITQYL